MSERVEAAGGVVVRDGMVLLVHRPRYDDWTLPKGKLDPGESFEDAALREVEEETGLRCRLVRELPSTQYAVSGRPKLVRYWLMDAGGRDALRAERRDGRAPLAADAGGGSRPAHLRPRPRACSRRRL